MSRRTAPDRPAHTSGGDVRRAEADGLESRVDAGLRVVRRPARLILEQADRADAPLRAEIEPVVRAPRHADQVAGLDLDREDRPCQADECGTARALR